MEKVDVFVSELVALCKRHKAEIFPRHDSRAEYVSVMLDDVWLDFKRIAEDGAERAK